MDKTSFTSWTLVLSCVLLFGAVTPALAQNADLGVGKSGPSTASPGDNVTYTVTVQNNGPDAATAAQFDDPVPAGMTFVSASQTTGPAFTCSTPAVGGTGSVTCSIATFANGAVATFSITLNIPPSTALNTSFVNSASASSSTFDPTPENDTGVAGTFVAGPQADVGITKTGPASVSANTDITYDITLTNAGPDPATTVSWTDTLPGGLPSSPLTFVSFTQNSGPVFSCGTASTTTTCTIATLAAGTTATFTFVGHVPNGTASGTTYTNTASVTSDSDPNGENDSATTTAAVSSADIAVVKSGPATAVAGAVFDYVITLSNGGPDPAVSASFTDPLPSGITFLALAQNSGPAANCATPAVGAGGSVACSIGLLVNGQSAQFTVSVTVDNSVANGTVLSNTVTAATASVDGNPGNNSSTANTTVAAQADLAVSKSGPAAVTAGATATYTLGVANNGPSAASAVVLSDTLPAGETFVSITQTAGPIFTCAGGSTVTCSIASLAAGASATFALVTSVAGSVVDGSTLTNTASVTSNTTDPTPGNNSASANSIVAATADLAISKSGPAAVTPGSNISYTLNLSNGGPSAASIVTLTDTLPTGENFVSFTQNAGPLFVCTTPPVGAGGTINCTNASLASSAVASFTLVVAVPSNAAVGTVLTNTATASSSTVDPGGANNSASANVTVGPAAVIAETPALDARMLLLLIVLLLGVAGAWHRAPRRGA